MMFGVSPAYVISLKGEQFTAADQAGALKSIAALGFDCFQPEVFQQALLEEWTEGGARMVGREAGRLGLRASQLVGHFLLKAFDSVQAVDSDWGIAEVERFASTLGHFPECQILTVPLPPFKQRELPEVELKRLGRRLREKVATMSRGVASWGGTLALEIMPQSLVGGVAPLRELLDAVEPKVGYNFDTGHAWASKEPVVLVPEASVHRTVIV